MRLRSPVLVACLVTGSAVHAQDGIYVGVGVGSFDFDQPLLDLVSTTISDSASTYKIFGGFELTDNLAFEIEYRETGDIAYAFDADIQPIGPLTYSVVTDFKIQTIKVLGLLPLDWGVLVGSLGYFSSDSDFRSRVDFDCCAPATNSGTISDNGMTASVGIEWRFGQFGTRYGLRLEYDWWDLEDTDTSALGLAFTYGF